MIKATHLSETLVKTFSGSTQGIAVCDVHGEKIRIEQLIQAIPQLKAMGLTHFFYEMFLSDDQQELSQYAASKDIDGLKKLINRGLDEQEIRRMKQEGRLEFAGYASADEIIETTEQYAKLALTLIENNIAVVGIDKQETPLPEYTLPASGEEDFEKKLDEHFADVQRFQQSQMLDRNKHWVQIIETELEQAQNPKYIVFGGGLHFYNLSLPGQMPQGSVSQALSIGTIAFKEDQARLKTRVEAGYISAELNEIS